MELSKKSIIALSLTEAKFIAIFQTSKEAIWILHFITEVFQPLNYPIKLYSDNQSAIVISYGNQHHQGPSTSTSDCILFKMQLKTRKSRLSTYQLSKCWQIFSQKDSQVLKPKYTLRNSTYIRLEGVCWVHICIKHLISILIISQCAILLFFMPNYAYYYSFIFYDFSVFLSKLQHPFLI